jgi:hypothetical protein
MKLSTLSATILLAVTANAAELDKYLGSCSSCMYNQLFSSLTCRCLQPNGDEISSAINLNDCLANYDGNLAHARK